MESKEEESKEQEFTYQNPILKNLEIETPNFQTPQNLNNTNPETINQQNLPPVIQPLQQPVQQSFHLLQQPQQLLQQQQQQLQQPPQQQQQAIAPMTYAPITKLEKFTGKEDNTQVWLNNITKAITVNNWNNVRALQAIPYFLQDTVNSLYQSLINKPQGETETAIQADYFTAPQILNQFIRGLYSSILQYVHSMHPADLQATVTNVKDFEATELEANHVQAINLVINESSDLDFKLKQFSDLLNQKLDGYLANTTQLQVIYQTSAISTLNLAQVTLGNPRSRVIQNWRSVIIVHQPILSFSNQPSESCQQSSGTGYTQNPSSQNYLSFLITPEDTTSNNTESNHKQTLTNNIPSVTITNDKLLTAIFLFELEELTSMPLFSGATLEKKPITTMYTNAKVNEYSIKLILNSGSVDNIIT
ncbi:hypothetical protein G9A89_017181 [Geosiphon pyriformis]|nr:hypothetical protein G9A89_017181 [Geosiphon pyriformis]